MKAIIVTPVTDTMLVSSTVENPVTDISYNAGTTYALNAPSTRANGSAGLLDIYKSLQAANTAHTPESSPTWWKLVGRTYQPYNVGTTYALAAMVLSGKRIYKSLQAGNVGHAVTDTTWWFDYGPSPYWAPFDELVDTQVFAASPITYVFNPGLINGYGLFGLVGTQAYFQIKVGGVVVWSETTSLDGSDVYDDYTYFFAPFLQKDIVTNVNVPPYDGEVTVTITGGDSFIGLGAIGVGETVELGELQYGATSGFTSFSSIVDNAQGQTEIIKKRAVKTISGNLWVKRSLVNSVSGNSLRLDGVNSIFVGVPGIDDYLPLTVYGFPTNFTATHSEYEGSMYAIAVRGF